MRNDLNLPITLLADLYGIPQIPNTIVDLDLIMQELLEGRDIENFVGGGLRGIDDKLHHYTVSHLGIRSEGGAIRTFFVIFPGFCPFPAGLVLRRALVLWVF